MRRLLSLVAVAWITSTTCFGGGIAKISADGKNIEVDGQAFHPWGVNYDRDYRMRLIEEYWHDEWPTVVSDFKEMKALGANAVRVHLQVAEFLESPDKPNERNLARLRDLLSLADEVGLKLDLTGLACYRKEKVPAWYADADEAERWRVQGNFWRAIARTCKGSSAVLFYDLINEPLVPVGKREAGDFLVGHLVDFWYCQFVTFDQKDRPRDIVARDWIRAMRAAIRDVDPDHLITVGILPNSTTLAPGQSGFLPATVGPELDFLCTHIYPRKAGKDLDEDLKTLEAFAAAGKPVVIEETWILNSGVEGLGEFLRRARPHATGVFGFYWGQTAADLAAQPSVGNAIQIEWLKFFAKGWPK